MRFTEHELVVNFKLRNPKIIGENLMCRCPFDKTNHVGGIDSHRSFGINMDTGQWNCYSCEMKGVSLRNLATKMRVLLADDLMRKIISADGARLPDRPDKVDKEFVAPRKKFDWNPDFGRHQEAFREVKHRGITLETIKRYKVGIDDAGSLLFPCIDYEGRLRGWIARNEQWPNRYAFMPSGVKRYHLMFGLVNKLTRVYLTESTTDMLRLCSWGLDAVSTCGNMIFEQQANELLYLCKEIVLVPQKDIPARKWVVDAKKLLMGRTNLLGIKIREGFKDVCEDRYTRKMWDEDSENLVKVVK